MIEVILGFFTLEENPLYEGIVLWLCIIMNIVFWERRLREKEEEVIASVL